MVAVNVQYLRCNMSVVDIELKERELKHLCYNCLNTEKKGFSTDSQKGRCDNCDALATVYPVKG